MSILNMDELWSEVHTLHHTDTFQYLKGSYHNQLEWKDRTVDTPNGELLKDNSFFAYMQNKPEKIYLLHVTKELEKIQESSTLYPSAGCLVGCIYTTQLYPESNNTFRLHNLGKHILQKEAVLTEGKSTPLIIEATYTEEGREQILSGIDYLKLGTIHYEIYQNLRYLLTPVERKDLEAVISSKIKKSLDFIALCSFIDNNSSPVSGREFISMMNSQIPNLPILGYLYFESIAQYTMLYSADPHSIELRKQGEFNNEIYKSFLLDIYEKIGKFKLSDFNISFEDLEQKLEELDRNEELVIDSSHFYEFIRDQVSHLVTQTFLNDPKSEPKWLTISWDFQGFSQILTPLLGHMIHRELRNFNRYKDFYFYFDQFKALSAWNYWNKVNIALPFNGPLQKGEIGINPAYPHVSYKIYTAKPSSKNSDLLVIDQELEGVEIAPRLVDLRHTAMRSKDHLLNKLKKEELIA